MLQRVTFNIEKCEELCFTAGTSKWFIVTQCAVFNVHCLTLLCYHWSEYQNVYHVNIELSTGDYDQLSAEISDTVWHTLLWSVCFMTTCSNSDHQDQSEQVQHVSQLDDVDDDGVWMWWHASNPCILPPSYWHSWWQQQILLVTTSWGHFLLWNTNTVMQDTETRTSADHCDEMKCWQKFIRFMMFETQQSSLLSDCNTSSENSRKSATKVWRLIVQFLVTPHNTNISNILEKSKLYPDDDVLFRIIWTQPCLSWRPQLLCFWAHLCEYTKYEKSTPMF